MSCGLFYLTQKDASFNCEENTVERRKKAAEDVDHWPASDKTERKYRREHGDEQGKRGNWQNSSAWVPTSGNKSGAKEAKRKQEQIRHKQHLRWSLIVHLTVPALSRPLLPSMGSWEMSKDIFGCYWYLKGRSWSWQLLPKPMTWVQSHPGIHMIEGKKWPLQVVLWLHSSLHTKYIHESNILKKKVKDKDAAKHLTMHWQHHLLMTPLKLSTVPY